MKALLKSHTKLLENSRTIIHRELFEEINWDSRLIGIKGTRGVGKTTFLLEYAKQHSDGKKCLYVNLNNFYFAFNSIISFADEFYKTGGKILILDQINKYPSWSKELRHCFDNFADLQIVFTCSPILDLNENNTDLNGIVDEYILEGLSFREFLNHEAGTQFKKISLNDIISYHPEVSTEILKDVKPLAYFKDYLHHGFYPFYTENLSLFSEHLLKTINLILEIDVTYLNQVEIKYFYKIKKLLYIAGNLFSATPNVSKISSEIQVSRATIMHYLNYLEKARLITQLRENDNDSSKKPGRIYLQNPNLMTQVCGKQPDEQIMLETFFCNQVGYKNTIEYTGSNFFRVNKELNVSVLGNNVHNASNGEKNKYLAIHMIEHGEQNRIPLWLFGFLN